MVVSLCVFFLWRDVVVYEGGGREKGLGYFAGNRTVDPRLIHTLAICVTIHS